MARGQPARAAEILLDAIQRCTRLPEGYLWGKANTLDALCSVAVQDGMPPARIWGDELMTLAAGSGMREMVVRAYLNQAEGGHARAGAAARALTSEIDNPKLRADALCS